MYKMRGHDPDVMDPDRPAELHRAAARSMHSEHVSDAGAQAPVRLHLGAVEVLVNG